MRNKLLLTVVVMGAVISLAALAEPGFGPPPGRVPEPEKMVEQMAKELTLTADQKAKFLADVKQAETDARKIREKNKPLFAALEKELLKDKPNVDLVHNYLKKINENETQIQIKRMDQMISFRQQLTLDQRLKLDKSMGERRDHGPKMGEKREPR